jgi:nicotinamidase-related amidase
MTDKLTLDPKTSALLVMDFQTAVVEMVATDKDTLLERTAKLIEAARKAGMRIIYVVVGFRPGYPEVSPRNQSFGPIRESGRFAAGSAGTDVHSAVGPQPGDVVVTKHRVSAFTGAKTTSTKMRAMAPSTSALNAASRRSS